MADSKPGSKPFGQGTYEERAKEMRRGLIEGISKGEISVPLSGSSDHQLAVMQVSAYGWVDFFEGRVHYSADDDELRHFSLTPSEMEASMTAYRVYCAAHRKSRY